MTIDQFAEMTRTIIARDGFDVFLPTACFPAQRNIAVLTGVPREADIESATLEWASGKSTPGEEVLVAFRVSSTQFKIIRMHQGQFQEAVYSAA